MSLSEATFPAWARLGLPSILALALLLRLAALAVPAVTYPDEVFQYLEPAHRLVFGYGVTTWEWRYGMRGWLIPLLLAGPMALGNTVAPASGAYLVLAKLLCVIFGLAQVAACWMIGARLSRRHGIAAALAAAIWYEGVYFAPHALSETLSIDAIMPAAALLLAGARRDDRMLAAAGALLGLAASLRFQHLPAIAVLAVGAVGLRSPRDWLPLLLGGIVGLVPSALADLVMGQTPYAWLVENIRQNLIDGQAAKEFGTSTIAGFLMDNRARWGGWIVPALGLAAIGARRAPALAWAAVADVAFHMALAHKEYRFVLLATAILILLAALGSVDLVDRAAARHGDAAGRARLRLLATGWLIASAMIAVSGFRGQWAKFGPQLNAAIALRQDPALCGLALYAHDYSTTGGYAYLHRDVPMLYVGTEEGGDLPMRLRGAATRVNTIVADQARAAELPAGFAPLRCMHDAYDRICVYRRPGGCDPRPSPDQIDRVLTRIGL